MDRIGAEQAKPDLVASAEMLEDNVEEHDLNFWRLGTT
jgi:hypothetical protein